MRRVPYQYLPIHAYFPPVRLQRAIAYRLLGEEIHLHVECFRFLPLDDPEGIQRLVNEEGWIAVRERRRSRPKSIRTFRDLLRALAYLHQHPDLALYHTHEDRLEMDSKNSREKAMLVRYRLVIESIGL